MVTRFFEKLQDKQPAYGAHTILNQTEVAELMGAMGLDFVLMDMMMGSLDWGKAASIMTASERYNITPMLRLPSYPWVGSGKNVDHHLAAEVLRALSIGVQGVVASLETRDQIESALAPMKDDHRRVYLPDFEFAFHGSSEEAHLGRAGSESPAMLIPLIESRLAVDTLPDLLSIDGLEAIFLGMGDLSVILGHANDFAHPALTEFIRETIEEAAKHDVKVLVNIHGRSAVPDVVAVAQEWASFGAAGVLLPYDTQIIIRFYRDVLASLRKPS
jgi:2-keto-3-deoxy-L-rhamnonate aldolase RhmA